MLSLLIYLFCFIVLFVISIQEHKTICFVLLSLILLQLIFCYYVRIGKITDILFYLVTLSLLDLLMVFSVIINNFILKDYHITMSFVALLAVFCTLFSIFDFYKFYYFQSAPMVVMEYLYFSIKQQPKFNIIYYALSITLVIPHILT